MSEAENLTNQIQANLYDNNDQTQGTWAVSFNQAEKHLGIQVKVSAANGQPQTLHTALEPTAVNDLIQFLTLAQSKL